MERAEVTEKIKNLCVLRVLRVLKKTHEKHFKNWNARFPIGDGASTYGLRGAEKTRSRSAD